MPDELEGKAVLTDVSDRVDVDRPLSLYLALRHRGYSYLLESVEKSSADKPGSSARFSFVGAGPCAVVSIKNRRLTVELESEEVASSLARRLSDAVLLEDGGGCVLSGVIRPGRDVFDALRCAIPASSRALGNPFGRPVFLGGGIGFLSYDLVKERFGSTSRSSVPDAQFAVTGSTVIFDHHTRTVYQATCSLFDQGEAAFDPLPLPVPVEEEVPELAGELLGAGDPEEYQEAVRRAKVHITDGDIFQVVIARPTRISFPEDPVRLYQRLRSINPSPYTYLFEFGDTAIVGASPETLFNIYSRKLRVNPIAGTCPRGRTVKEDEDLARAMLGDEKERAEHIMLVDLGRNDVRSVSQSGTVKVEDFMSVLRYSHVQHIETLVCGDLRAECDQFDAARSVFPAGTVSGAPKLRAMEIIDTLEGEPRGIYAGGVGYFSCDGSTDFAIAIRSVVIQDGVATVQAGAGIVADSDPYREYMETERKMAAMRKALGA
ncbi:MAG: anthranilate synthase component I [Methanosarcinales archaeon]|nr:anthranilate synthase component I [Methanosarcinales archaeon]